MVTLTSTPQFIGGKEVEAYLDQFFQARGSVIRQTTPYEEQVLCLGDRYFTKGGYGFFVEYKSGLQTGATGNVFLETVSNDSTCAPGWVYTCQAEYLIYACLLNHKILVFRPEKLRSEIGHLKREFKTKKTDKQNENYKTHGVIVPLYYAEEYLALKVIHTEAAAATLF